MKSKVKSGGPALLPTPPLLPELTPGQIQIMKTLVDVWSASQAQAQQAQARVSEYVSQCALAAGLDPTTTSINWDTKQFQIKA